MLDLFKELSKIKTITGVELVLDGEGIGEIHACTLSLQGDQLGVEKGAVRIKNLEHFCKNGGSGPIAVCISGKGVLTKVIPEVADHHQLMNQVLPNANSDEFYIQTVTEQGTSRVSLIRKTTADQYLDQFTKKGFVILALNLDRYLPSEVPMPAEIDPLLLPAYVCAFEVFTGLERYRVQHPEFEENYSQLLAKATLKAIGAVFGCAVFLLLLANFAAYSHYGDALQNLMLHQNSSAAEISRYQGLERELSNKLQFVKHVGWTGGYSCAWLTDQLMAGMPKTIVLSQISLNPSAEKTKSDQDEQASPGRIQIRGNTPQAAVLNNWLFEIRDQNWVNECSVLAYEQNKELMTGMFTIEIALRDYQKP